MNPVSLLPHLVYHRNMVCFRYIIVNTLHKGDNKDNNNVSCIFAGPRRRWMDNIRKDLQEVGCGYMDWIGLVQDRDRWRTLVSAVMNLGVP